MERQSETGADTATGTTDIPDFPFAPGPPLGLAPEFARLRARPGLGRIRLPGGDLAWLATRHADVRAVLSSPDLSRAAATAPGAPRLGPARPERASMAAMDPPDHTRLRRLVTPAFSPARMERLRPRIGRLAGELLEAMAGKGAPGDLVSGLGGPLPMLVISELLGVPASDREFFTGLAENSLRVGAGSGEAVRRAREVLQGYFAEMVEDRIRRPSDDFVGHLVAARAAEGTAGGLTEVEITALCSTVLTAGYHPVSNVLTGALLALLRPPRLLDSLPADGDGLRRAVEELLRFVPGPVSGGTIRVAARDTEIAGTAVRAGEAVLPATSSANRDPAVFADPDRLDLGRAENPHIAFGPGIHHCLGAALARAELAGTLAEVRRRLPGLRLDRPVDELAWTSGTMIRKLVELPVRW